LKDYEKAKEYYEDAMIYDVSNINTPKFYISCLLENEDLDEAEKLIKYAVKIKGIDKCDLWYQRSLLSEKRGSLTNAMKFLDIAEGYCFGPCSWEVIKDRKKFLKAKMTSKKRKKKKETN
jgi:tetratricopeptide (TPR) repeat protein